MPSRHAVMLTAVTALAGVALTVGVVQTARSEGPPTDEDHGPELETEGAATDPARPGSEVAVDDAGADERDEPEGTEGEDAPDGLFVLWARGGLPTTAAEAAAELEHVTGVTAVRSATLGLVGSRDAGGDPVDVLDDGYRIPVSAMAIDPADRASRLDDPAHRDAVAALRPGQVLLSETSADRRGLGAGGRVDLEDLADLEVAAILPDRAVRGVEVVVHEADAGAAGIPEGAALFVTHRAEGSDRAALEDQLGELLPADTRGRVVDRDGTGRVPLVLSLTQRKHHFGEFAYRPHPGQREIDIDPAWIDEHIVDARVPVLGTVRCHRHIVDDLRAALEEIVEQGHDDWIDPSTYGGCFHPRRISAERDGLSSHAWGIAIDINVDLSMPGLGPVPPDGFIEAFGRHGFRWGGDFVTPDNHHYEWVGEYAHHRPTRPETD